MEKYRLAEVKTVCDRAEFLKMATRLYKGDPNWVQPLDADINAVFDPKTNPLFVDGEAVRWLLIDTESEKTVGRIAAFYNREKAATETQPTGGCGFFECIDSQQAANVLFDAAREWLAARGMEAMDGSINFGERMKWWGVLVEGFTMPLYGMPYNHPYYGALFEGYGFQTFFNQHSYLRVLDIGVMPEAIYQKAERLFANPDYSFPPTTMKDLPKLAEDFRAVYNSGWADFMGVQKLSSEEALSYVNDMKAIIDPRIITFAYYKGEPIGFFVNIPDINEAIYHLGGKFNWWAKLKFLYYMKISRRPKRVYGMVFGVSAEFQGRGVEAAMIRCFEKVAAENRNRYANLEMAWVGDFNPLMMRMCESYVMAVKFKRHVTYRYLFDRTKPFERAPRMGKKKPVAKSEDAV